MTGSPGRPSAQQEIVAVIDAHRPEHGSTVVYVTHEITPIAGVVDQVLYVAAGRWAAGPPGTVLTTQSLSALYGTHIDVIRVPDHIVIIGGDGTGPGTCRPRGDPAGRDRGRHNGHAGLAPSAISICGAPAAGKPLSPGVRLWPF